MKVGVVGLGKLGLCMATVYAKYGFDVVGVDTDASTVAMINQRKCPSNASEEKGLSALLEVVPLKASTQYSILNGCSMVFIIVPTPSQPDGKYDNSYILECLKRIRLECEWEDVNPIVVVKSTVTPGTCEKEFMPVLDGTGIGLCYSAEMVGLGNVIQGLEHPEELLVGCSSKEDGDKLEYFYKRLFHGREMPKIRRMSLWNAELSKLALNVFLISKVNLANTVARLCDKNPTGNVKDVLGFVGGDSRIGSKFLETGLGMGGPCFPRDCGAFINVAGSGSCDIPQSVDRVNISQSEYIYEGLKPLPKRVSILGVTYKPEIQLLDASRAILLINRMLRDSVSVTIHDPKGLPQARLIFGDRVHYATSIDECLLRSELAVICTAWDCYKTMDVGIINKNMKVPVVYDCWGIWDKSDMQKQGIRYHAFGVAD